MLKQLGITAVLVAAAVFAVTLSELRGVDDGAKVQRVPIERLDFDGLDLTFADYLNPPLADQHPPVIATVNGEELTNKSLASQEVLMELNRRSLVDDLASDFWKDINERLLAEQSETDPLELLIDQVMWRQAVERLGMLPPYEEAVEYTREQENRIVKSPNAPEPDDLARILEMQRALGYPETDWASEPRMVKAYRYQLGLAELRKRVCGRSSRAEEPRRTCSDFLAEEREAADIVYYVRWAD